MKRCPKCRRDYYDATLLYCLDDGEALLDGPATDGPATAVLPGSLTASEGATQAFDSPASVGKVSSGTRSIIAIAAAVIVMTAVGIGAYLYSARGVAKQIGTIAVLPFVNQSGNPEIEYFSDGITESLINSLSQIPAVSVKARSSVFTYKGRDVSPQQVAKDLSVEAVLTGRVAQRGDLVVLNVELVDTSSGNHIWGDQYTRKISDVFELEGEIARDVSGKLRAKLTGEEEKKIAKNYTQNTEAYQLYLRGRHFWNKRTADDLKRSIVYFQQAIDKDPTYALAHGALAEAYILLPNYGAAAPQDSYPKARAAAGRAIEIDPSLAEGHNAMASILSNFDWKFAEAEIEWRKAIELNPSYATAHQWYAEHLMNMGRYEDSLVEMRRAQELDPLSLIINGLTGIALLLSGQQDAALEQLKKTLEMDPNFARTHFFLSTVYQVRGDYDSAVDEFARGVILSGAPADEIQLLAARVKEAARTGGERGYSRALAESITGRTKQAAVVPANLVAGLWVKAGENDKAIKALEEAYAARDDSILRIKDPSLEPLKSDPRYVELLRKIGLPPG